MGDKEVAASKTVAGEEELVHFATTTDEQKIDEEEGPPTTGITNHKDASSNGGSDSGTSAFVDVIASGVANGLGRRVVSHQKRRKEKKETQDGETVQAGRDGEKEGILGGGGGGIEGQQEQICMSKCSNVFLLPVWPCMGR